MNVRNAWRRCGVAAALASAATGLVLATGQVAQSKVVAPMASCSAEQKSARQAALLRFKQGMAAGRRAYFKTHREVKLRRAFVRRQSARLRVLETAAACTVPALPPSSRESCTFKFPPNQGTFRFSEGPLSSDWLSPRGRVDAVLIFVDFPDAPGVNVSGLVPRLTTHVPWFDEVSYGRFNLSVTPVQSWFRLPRPTSSYAPKNNPSITPTSSPTRSPRRMARSTTPNSRPSSWSEQGDGLKASAHLFWRCPGAGSVLMGPRFATASCSADQCSTTGVRRTPSTTSSCTPSVSLTSTEGTTASAHGTRWVVMRRTTSWGGTSGCSAGWTPLSSLA